MRIKQAFDHLPIVYKLSLFMIGLICIVFFLVGLIIRSTLLDLIHQQTDRFGHTIATQTAHAAGELLLAEDLLALKVLASQVSQSSTVVRVSFLNNEGETLADYETSRVEAVFRNKNNPVSSEPASRHHTQYSAPIMYQDVTAGQAIIIVDQSAINAAFQRTLSWMALALALILLVSVPAAYFLSRYWAEPIKELTEATSEINAGSFQTRLTRHRQDEFGTLIKSFNDMAQSLQERERLKSTFYRYVGSGIANQVLFQAGDPIVPLRSIEATVVFFDIVSFTRLCQNQSAQTVAQMLNQYYACIQMCCAEFGGIVDKYIGDGALVVFGADNNTPDHARNALLASHLFQTLAREQLFLSAPPDQSESPPKPLLCRIGIHSGSMLAGTLGHKDRLQYTVIGDTVNVAARLCQQGPIDQIVLSTSTLRAIEEIHPNAAKPLYHQDLGQWQVRGRDETVTVYQSLSLPETLNQLIQQRKKLLTFQLSIKPELEHDFDDR